MEDGSYGGRKTPGGGGGGFSRCRKLLKCPGVHEPQVWFGNVLVLGRCTQRPTGGRGETLELLPQQPSFPPSPESQRRKSFSPSSSAVKPAPLIPMDHQIGADPRTGDTRYVLSPLLSLFELRRPLNRPASDDDISWGVRIPEAIARARDQPMAARLPASDSYNYGSSDDVEFSVTTSAEGGIDVKIGSHTIRVLKYLSVHNPLIQLVLFVVKRFEDTFACVKSIAPRSVFDMARRLRSSASPSVCETGWISAKSGSESPNAVTVSEFDPGKSIRRSNELTENESQHRSYLDSCGKTSATWAVTTAAPHHATGNRALLSDFITERDDQFVHVVDETPMQVLARGTVVTNSVVLHDVWFVPGLTANLVSVSQLAELGYSFEFGRGMCYIRRASDDTIVGRAHLRKGGLYVLDFLKVPLAM